MDACTIITGNFLASARTLVTSYRMHHPSGRFFVLLLDEPKGLDVSKETFTIIRPSELGLPNLAALSMLYTAYELSMALRPEFLLLLQQKHASEKTVFLDSDLFFTGNLQETEALLDRHSIILTPSFFTPIPDDGYFPSDRDFLAAGIFNGGFFACRACEETRSTLRWLAERLQRYAYYRPEEAMFGDQKWLDLLPAVAPTLHILRHPGYNVSHWNLHERPLTLKQGRIFAAEEPMIFYHFSGYKPGQTSVLSVHQNRFTLEHHPILASLVRNYNNELLRSGWSEISRLPYARDNFSNGIRISPVIRRIFEAIKGSERFADPFEISRGSYVAWLLSPLTHLGKTLPLRNIHLEIWRLSAEAQAKFPQPATKDLAGFCRWICEERARELALDPSFTDNLRAHIRTDVVRKMPPWKILLRRRHTWEAYQKFCRGLKTIIGRKLYDRLKPRRDPMYALRLRIGFGGKEAPQSLGINIVSSKEGQSGIAQALRGYSRALEENGIAVSHTDSRLMPGRQSEAGNQSLGFPYETTLIGGGMEEIAMSLSTLEIPGHARGTMIAFAPWELETLPTHVAHFLEDNFGEVWTTSTFSARAIGQSVRIPVLAMPLCVDVSGTSEKSRTDFGIPASAKVFLFVCDFYSRIERKNPASLITSFIQEFAYQKDVILVISATHSADFPEEFLALQSLVQSHANIRLMTEYLKRSDLLSLLRTADCYVSLHRSEGFGLLLTEAMALGIPVIATDYGGSTDFLSTSTGYPVAYRLTTIEKKTGPYSAGEIWAEPEISDAARLMRHVIDHPEEATKKATAAKMFIETRYTKRVVAACIQKRLEILRRSSDALPAPHGRGSGGEGL